MIIGSRFIWFQQRFVKKNGISLWALSILFNCRWKNSNNWCDYCGTYNFNLTEKLQFKNKRHIYEKIISLILSKIICSINRDQIFEQSLLAMRFGTNYVIRASRNRWNFREVIVNRRWLRGRRLDGNPIGRICLAYFVAHGRDGRVIARTPRVLDVIAPRWLPPLVLVFLGSLDHRS